MPKTLDDLNEWARLLRKENHPLAETMEEIAEGWREDIDYLKKGTGMSELEPCCICKKDWNSPNDIIDTLYPSKRDTKTGEFVEWNVVCQLHNTGCGRAVYAKSEDEAIRRWNQGFTDEIMDW